MLRQGGVVTGHRSENRHRWWHLRSWYTAIDGRLIVRCMTCDLVLQDVEDDGYRCEVCGSAFCDPMAHH